MSRLGRFAARLRKAPSGSVIACWRCRALTEEAGLLEVKPSELKAWKSEVWQRVGWATLCCVGLGVIAGMAGFGFAMLAGLPVFRVCEVSIGLLVGVTPAAALVCGHHISEQAFADLRRMKAERLEARRLSS